MAKDIMTSGIEMSDVIKTTGFPVPEDMEGKTFAECVSGGGGNVTLYAWISEDGFYMQCYTYTDNPKAGDTVLAGAKGDMSSEIIFDVVESVEENIINTHINDVLSYKRYPVGDKVLQAGEEGSIVAEPLAVTENGVYTAPSGKAYTPVTVNVPSGGAFRYFDGRESGYSTMPTGFWVIRKDQTSGNAHCLITTNSSTSNSVLPIKKLTSEGLMVDEYGRETFHEVTEDVVLATLT